MSAAIAQPLTASSADVTVRRIAPDTGCEDPDEDTTFTRRCIPADRQIGLAPQSRAALRGTPDGVSASGSLDGALTITDDAGREVGGLSADSADALFGPAIGGPMVIEIHPEAMPAAGHLICVRQCDGYFFPLDATPVRGDASSLCQALCPGAETSAFRVPDGPVDLTQAVSLAGRPYASLAGAFRFQTRRSPTCGCKGEAQSWAPLLGRAESLIRHEPGDVVVTDERSAAMSRPRGPATNPGRTAAGGPLRTR